MFAARTGWSRSELLMLTEPQLISKLRHLREFATS